MQCPQCSFENIPGQKRCLRCGAVLGAGAGIDSVYPPRMARWKRPMRAAGRGLRKVVPEGKTELRVPAFLKIMSGNAALGLILSIIPGLAHLISGRFKEVRWYVLGWFVMLAGGIYFYATGIGFLLLGIAISLHVWIAIEHALIKEHDEITTKLFNFVALIVLFGLLYFGIRRVAFGDFVFGHTNLTLPYQQIESGDLLLARESLAHVEMLPRGSVVIGRLSRIFGGHERGGHGYRTTMQIIGLGGEQVQIVYDSFVVNDQVLDKEQFPVPQWLLGRNLGVVLVPEKSYFVSSIYNIEVYGAAAMEKDALRNACLVGSSEIEAKAIMRWFPLGRRGFMRTDE